jgi:hypothetical protein
MSGYKSTTHLEDEYTRNVYVVLDMWPYKESELEMMISKINLG